MTLTAHPTFPAIGSATFNADAYAWAVFMAGTNKTELDALNVSLNALAAAMGSLAAGTATAIPYTFSSTTTVADPGAGYLRLDNATQNTAIAMLTDLVGSDGSTWTSLLDTFDDSTSTIKGFIMLMKASDATKWLLFSVSALASPAGYKNITVANVASSSASPFSNGDAVLLKFQRNGDKGDTGATGATGAAGVSGAFILLATLTPTAAANLDLLSSFNSSYNNYKIIGEGITVGADDTMLMRLATGGAADTGSNYYGLAIGGTTTATSTSVTASPAITSAGRGCSFQIDIQNVNDATRLKTISGFSESEATATPGFRIIQPLGIYTAANTVSGVRFFLNGGSNFAATGKIRVYGYANT